MYLIHSILCVTTLDIHQSLHLSWHSFVERFEVDSVIILLTLREILFGPAADLGCALL